MFLLPGQLTVSFVCQAIICFFVAQAMISVCFNSVPMEVVSCNWGAVGDHNHDGLAVDLNDGLEDDAVDDGHDDAVDDDGHDDDDFNDGKDGVHDNCTSESNTGLCEVAFVVVVVVVVAFVDLYFSESSEGSCEVCHP